MLIYSRANWVSFTNIYLWQLTVFRRTYEDVDTGLGELFATFHCGQNGSWAY
jgi:hypothetical protein